MNMRTLASLFGVALGLYMCVVVSISAFLPCSMSETGTRGWLLVLSLAMRGVAIAICFNIISPSSVFEKYWNALHAAAVILAFASIFVDIHVADNEGCPVLDKMSNEHLRDKLFPGSSDDATLLIGKLADGQWDTYLHYRYNWCDSTLVGMLQVSKTMKSIAACTIGTTGFNLAAYSYHNLSLIGNLVLLLFVYTAWVMQPPPQIPQAEPVDIAVMPGSTADPGSATMPPVTGKTQYKNIAFMHKSTPLVPALRQRTKSGRIQF